MKNSLRKTGRLLKIGKTIQYIKGLKQDGIKRAFELTIAKRRYLSRILRVRPFAAGVGSVEVHMLLNHGRAFEGLWSLYSFAHFCGVPCQITVHDDGTLTDADLLNLNRIFPGCRVINRRHADSVVTDYLSRKGLNRCIRLRETLAFGMKLFDPFFFLRNDFFILLDSDVLFFSAPTELTKGLDSDDNDIALANLYSSDNGYRYCLGPDEINALLGTNCLERVNPGLLRLKKDILDFNRIERYLQHPNFWNEDDTANYYSELTVWAMELSRVGAFALPETYAICGDPRNPNLVSGHYCGGGYWADLFYIYGLPRLAPILRKPACPC